MRSRRGRLHVPNGTYYVVQFADTPHLLFDEAQDYVQFETFLRRSMTRMRARTLAFCWLPSSIHLVVEIGTIPLGRFMQSLTGCYSRYVRDHRGKRRLFADRYRSILIDPETWLVRTARYVHALPRIHGMTLEPQTYPHSSCAVYLGSRSLSWLHRAAPLIEASTRVGNVLPIAEPPDDADVALFSSLKPHRAHVLGHAEIRTRWTVAEPQSPSRSLEELIHLVCKALDVDKTRLTTRSREHKLVLARALIAWHARERRIASIATVAQRLGRDPSSLSSAITRCEAVEPKLFRLSAFHYLVPIA